MSTYSSCSSLVYEGNGNGNEQDRVPCASNNPSSCLTDTQPLVCLTAFGDGFNAVEQQRRADLMPINHYLNSKLTSH